MGAARPRALGRGHDGGARFDAEAEDEHRDAGCDSDDAERRHVSEHAHHWMSQEIDPDDDLDEAGERSAPRDAALEAADEIDAADDHARERQETEPEGDRQ